jgi:hypothetical protein
LQKFRLSAHLLGVFFDDVFGSPVWFTQSAVNTFVWVDDQSQLRVALVLYGYKKAGSTCVDSGRLS